MKIYVQSLAKKFNNDKKRLLDIFWEIQNKYGWISPDVLENLKIPLGSSIPELRDTLSFYHFFHDKPAGKHQIYLDTSAIAELSGGKEVSAVFQTELGVSIGEVTEDGNIGLYETSCIGMSDQSPAALIDMVPVTNLTPDKVYKIVTDLKLGKVPKAKVTNIVHQEGPVFFAKYEMGDSVNRLKELKPSEILEMVKKSGLRGRGGAGFSTGLKWEYCSKQVEKTRYVVCNADEGEPGTFKDRYLLTEKPELLIDGMIAASYGLGAKEGFIYLRGEYSYLLNDLNNLLSSYRQKKLLGKNFDIRIQLGAGSYVVGEETALLESMEGKRGEPRVRPPFPVGQGYLGKPTIINNVETFASVAQILKHGVDFYRQFGTQQSEGTKLLSVSGDVEKPGIYEIEWGQSIGEFLKMVGAKNPQAVQVGGPSGEMISAMDKTRNIAFEDLPTGGSMMVFSKNRNLLKIVKNFIQFFVNESCGCCLPCRAGNIVLNEQTNYILAGEAAREDLERIKAWSKIISKSSRCGLGQTCANPLTTSLKAFPDMYLEKVCEHESDYRAFDIESKLNEYKEVVALHEELNKS